MSLKAKVEAIVYAAEEPVTLEQIAQLLNDAVLADLAAARENAALEQANQANAEPETQAIVSDPESAESASESAGTELTPTCEESLTAGDLSSRSEAELASDASQSVQTESVLQEFTEASGQATETPGAEPTSAASASVTVPASTSRKRKPQRSEQEIAQDKAVRARIREILVELVTDYASEERGMEIRQVAGGFRMATKPEHHDVVRAFAKSLKPPIRLSLAALETLAVVAYKQPITAPEIADIRGIESASVIGTLLDRKLITTAGRKQVIGRPMQYKTSKDFLLRFGLNDVNELPSMEEFSQLAADATILASEETSTEAAQSDTPQPPSLFEPESEADSVLQSESVESESPAQDSGSSEVQPEVPEPQSTEAAETSTSQPQSEAEGAESSKVPEAERQ